jgi:hypothetical protein
MRSLYGTQTKERGRKEVLKHGVRNKRNEEGRNKKRGFLLSLFFLFLTPPSVFFLPCFSFSWDRNGTRVLG